MTRRWKIAVAAVAAIVAGAIGFMFYIGYLGRADVFRDMPATGPQRPFAAVFLSGDMGFSTGMGPIMAGRLVKDGVPVVGVNMLHFLRTTRTPAEVTALLGEAMRRAMALGHTDRIVVIGQSFGADMVHVALADLPAPLKAHVVKVVMIVPESTVDFRASPSEIFSLGVRDEPAMPTARQLGWVPTLCVHGEEEKISLCPLLHQRGITTVAVPGGHAMHGDEDILYAAISRFLFH